MTKRISLIDEVRGLLIILVVIYHACYNLAVIYRVNWIRESFSVMRALQPTLPFMFILISGISFGLSRSNLKRGIKLAAAAAGISAALWIFMPQNMIWFGIIHFLALANIALSPLKKYLDRIPAAAGLALCAVMFIVTYNVSRGYLGFKGAFAVWLPEALYQSNALVILGFRSASFVSYDYIPILPWIFPFLSGIILCRYVKRFPESLRRVHVRLLAFAGRHTLLIYLLHQPIIMGIMYLISK